MSRKIDLSKPLSAADLTYLRARYSEAYVARMVELSGGAGEEARDVPETAEETEEPQGTPETPGVPETDVEDVEEGDEDLIGDAEGLFEPADHNVDEVLKHLRSADDAEKSRVLAAEATGKGRSGILNA